VVHVRHADGSRGGVCGGGGGGGGGARRAGGGFAIWKLVEESGKAREGGGGGSLRGAQRWWGRVRCEPRRGRFSRPLPGHGFWQFSLFVFLLSFFFADQWSVQIKGRLNKV
jgi:hypothetical protein